METENGKYNKLLNVLRKSTPVLKSTEDIERVVLNSISKNHRSNFFLSDAVEFLFGWIYIGWVRRSLITVATCLVVVFVIQQGIILKQIKYLSSQTVMNNSENAYEPSEMIEKKLLLYKLSGRRFRSQSITISEKQMVQLLDSVNELKVRYKDLMNLINSDPELKKYVEKKLVENNRTKINL